MEKRRWFAFNPDKETLIAIIAGLVVIGLSLLMPMTERAGVTLVSIILRDLLMIFGIGIVFVILRILKISDFKTFGIKTERLWLALIINIVLAIALTFIMTAELDMSKLTLNKETWFRILYILIAGVFECLFFYTYQRVVFERAFGKTAAIILVSFFYSLHHAGFQPEFMKLFFVGISFVLVVTLTNNIFSIFPFYWSVGAVLDVLVQSQEVSPLLYAMPRSLILMVLSLIFIIIIVVKQRKAKSELVDSSIAV